MTRRAQLADGLNQGHTCRAHALRGRRDAGRDRRVAQVLAQHNRVEHRVGKTTEMRFLTFPLTCR